MKFQYAILREVLEERGYRVNHRCNPEFAIDGVQYFRKTSVPSDGVVLWVVDEGNLDAFRSMAISAQGSAILCVEKDLVEKRELYRESREIILAPAGASAMDAVETANQILQEYFDWVQAMMREIVEAIGFTHFLNTAAKPLKNPVAVVDQNFTILARSKFDRDLPSGTIWDRMLGETFNVSDFYSSSEMHSISRGMREMEKNTICFRSEKDPEHMYCSMLLLVDGKECGCVAAADVFEPLSEGQISRMQIIRDMTQLYLKSNHQKRIMEKAEYGVFHDLITGKAYKKNRLQGVMERMQWKAEDRYLLLSVLPAISYHTEIERVSFVNQIHLQFPKAVIVAEENCISILMRKSDYDYEKVSWRNFVSVYAAENHMFFGCSFPFYHILQSNRAFLQSTYAAQFARDNERALVDYADVQENHVLQALAEKGDLKQFCDPRLIALSSSKKESDRLLIPCLKAYLLNGRNIAQTARALYLHRNTVIYRIEKLAQYLDINFNQSTEQELFSLIISCYILTSGF